MTQRHHELFAIVGRQVRHVRRRRVCGLRALLLRGPTGRPVDRASSQIERHSGSRVEETLKGIKIDDFGKIARLKKGSNYT